MCCRRRAECGCWARARAEGAQARALSVLAQHARAGARHSRGGGRERKEGREREEGREQLRHRSTGSLCRVAGCASEPSPPRSSRPCAGAACRTLDSLKRGPCMPALACCAITVTRTRSRAPTRQPPLSPPPLPPAHRSQTRTTGFIVLGMVVMAASIVLFVL
jgi:hypothetical protein